MGCGPCLQRVWVAADVLVLRTTQRLLALPPDGHILADHPDEQSNLGSRSSAVVHKGRGLKLADPWLPLRWIGPNVVVCVARACGKGTETDRGGATSSCKLLSWATTLTSALATRHW